MENLEKYIKDHRTAFDDAPPSFEIWAKIDAQLSTEKDLETFVADNRTAFDTAIPSLKIWANVNKKINLKSARRVVLMRWIGRAAAVAALLIVGADAGIYLNEKRETIVADKEMERIAPNFRATEQFYNQKVQAQLTKLASYDQADPSVLADLRQIDDVQNELKAELENAPTSTREEIVRRMIQNYQIKLGILERVLQHVEEAKSEEHQQREDLRKI